MKKSPQKKITDSRKMQNKAHIVKISLKLFLLIWFFSLAWHMITFSFFDYVFFSGKKRNIGKREYTISIENFGDLGKSKAKEEKKEEKQEQKQENEQEEIQETEKQETKKDATNDNINDKSDSKRESEADNDGDGKTKDIASLLGIGSKKNTSSKKKSDSNTKKVIQQILKKHSQNKKVYSLRTKKNRQKAVKKYGGSAESENSVELGLKWLIKHQDYDGKWDTVNYYKHSNKQECWGRGYRKYTPGATALAYLCFLAAGYTPKEGIYSNKLQKTETYLLGTQDSEGFFGGKEMYNHSIILMSLCESYVLTKNEALAPVIRSGVAAAISAQQPLGGWTYQANPQIERNDSSIAGWVIMALVAAKKAGFHVPQKVFNRAWNHFERMTNYNGDIRYEDVGPHTLRLSKALIPVALLSSVLMNKKNPQAEKQINIMKKYPPKWSLRYSIDNSMYYWYYGTLALFLSKDNSWHRWNIYMRDMLIFNQIKKGNAKGSWDPTGKWCSAGGRIYSTAINILNLEIYYRYHPNFIK